MIKTPVGKPQLAALIVFVLSCVVVLLYLWISFGGSVPLSPESYRLQVAFPQANELAVQADVRIAGINVGKVASLRLDRQDNRTLATLEIERQYAPLPRDTRAALRIKTLLGETYIELSPGSSVRGSLADGGRLPDGSVAPNVDLDQILATFDPRTRAAFQAWLQAQAAGLGTRGADLNASLGNLPGFVDSGQRLLATLDSQSRAVRGLVANTGMFFDAVSRRQGELSGLITAADQLFQTTARRNQDLADLFRALPGFESQTRLTLPALTRLAQGADPVVRALEPIATELTRTFAATSVLTPQLRGLFERLGPTVTASRAGLPALDRILGKIPSLLGAFEPFLRNANPIVDYIGAYRREVTGFFGNVVGASQAHDVQLPRTPNEVHYLRTSQTLTPEALALLSRPLGMSRDDAYRAPGAFSALAAGLPVLDAAGCASGNPAPPASAIPASLVTLVQRYVFRTPGRNIAAPPCRRAGLIPGFSTAFPRLRAEPPPSVAPAR
jgi:phospholipid/cholesterol/gamma-HCH transport system substrate-binding protein